MTRKLFFAVLVAAIIILPDLAFTQINVDHAVFRYDSQQEYWEIFYTILRNQMTYAAENNGDFSCLALIHMSIKRDDQPWKKLSWKIQDVIPDTSQEELTKNFIDRVQILVPPGNLAATIVVQDLHSDYVDSVSFAAAIPNFPPGSLQISDIELASSIKANSQEKQNPFYKNTLLVVPNPSRVYGPHLPTLYFYAETYHLMQNVAGSNYGVQYSILDGSGAIKEKKSFLKKKQVDNSVEIGMLPVDTLFTGAYLLHFAVTDSVGQEVAFRDAKFFVYNTERMNQKNLSKVDENKLFLHTEFADMGEILLDTELEYTTYFSSLEERNIYKTLNDVDAKRRFLFSIWFKRDPTPLTPANEYRQEYMKRVEYCNDNFSTFKQEGWKTDRGRVHILYGPPTYVDRNPSTEGNKPYEIWQYDDIQGGVVFVFADMSGFKDYIQIHSTALGEPHYPDYMERIKRGF